MAAHVDHPLRRSDDPGEDLEERALPGAIGPDDRERLAVDDPERDIPERPELPVPFAPAGHGSQRLPKGVLSGQPEVVADAQATDLDRTRLGPGRARL